MPDPFGVEKALAARLAGVASRGARKLGYPVKAKPTTSVKMAPSGQSMETVETSGRHGTWAFKPSESKRVSHSGPDGKLFDTGARKGKAELTRKGKVAAASSGGAAYVGAVVAESHSRKVRKSAFGVEHVGKGLPEVAGATAGASVNASRSKKLLNGQAAPIGIAPPPSALTKVKAKLTPIAGSSDAVT